MTEKEITLPWTCETSDKIKWLTSKIFEWFILIASPTVGIVSVTTNYLGTFSNAWYIYFVVAAISWAIKVTMWDESGKITHLKFRCKQQPKPEVSQK